MFTIILFLAVGSIMVYLAQNNLAQVPLHLGPYVFLGIPLFYIIIGSLLLGFIWAYVVHLVSVMFTSFTIRGKDHKIKQGKDDIAGLTKQVHKLELENERLKNNSTTIEPADSNAL